MHMMHFSYEITSIILKKYSKKDHWKTIQVQQMIFLHFHTCFSSLFKPSQDVKLLYHYIHIHENYYFLTINIKKMQNSPHE